MNKNQYKDSFGLGLDMLDADTEKRAAEFIRRAVVAGFSEDEIRESFLKKGYPPEEVARLLEIYIKKEAPVEHHYAKYLLFVIGILIVVLVVLFLLAGKRMCDNQECFIGAANSCKETSLKQYEEGSIFTYEIRKTDEGCTLVKTATDISDNEPSETKELLEGKSMSCVFSEGGFNPNWLNYLTKDIDGCYGELRDGLESITSNLQA